MSYAQYSLRGSAVLACKVSQSVLIGKPKVPPGQILPPTSSSTLSINRVSISLNLSCEEGALQARQISRAGEVFLSILRCLETVSALILARMWVRGGSRDLLPNSTYR